jgi:transmembrane sensor
MPQINVMSGEVRISDGVDYALQILQQVSTGFSYTRDEKTNVIVIK